MEDLAPRMDLVGEAFSNRRSLIQLLLCCLLILGTAGCGPTPTPSAVPSASVSAVPTPVPPSPGPQTNPVDRDALQNGGDLRIGVPSFTPTWNPWDSSPFALDPVLDAMTPRFFAAAADGVLHWDSMWLASEPTVRGGSSTSPSGSSGSAGLGEPSGSGEPMRVTYALNPRAVWSDGAPITIADFYATWQACLASAGPICADRGFEHVIGIDWGPQSQIVVTYDGPYAGWQYTFARGPSRAEAVTDHGTWYGLGGHQGAFSGPYVYSSSTASGVTLVRNPLWWGPYPKLDSIEINVIDDPVLAYLQQDLDGFWVTDANLFARASALAGIQVRRSIGPDARHIAMNCDSGPLSDPTVRRAVLMGLDRTRLSASDLAGWKWDGTPLNSPLWLSGQPQYVDLVAASDGFDAKTAADLLDEDGWDMSESGVRTRHGVELAWDFLIPQGDSLAENEGFGLRVQLGDLGVNLELRYVDPAQFDADLASGQYGMAGLTYHYTTPLAAASQYSTGNVFAYSSLSADSLIARTQTQLDPTAQASTFTDLADLLWTHPPVIPLYEFPEIFLVRDGLANYGPNELGTLLWENVGWAS